MDNKSELNISSSSSRKSSSEIFNVNENDLRHIISSENSDTNDQESTLNNKKTIVELMREKFNNPSMSQTEMQDKILIMSTGDIEKMVGIKSWQFLKPLDENGLRWHLYYQIPKDMPKRKKIFEEYNGIPSNRNYQKSNKSLMYRPDGKPQSNIKSANDTYNTYNVTRKRKPIFQPKEIKYGTIRESKSWMERIFGSCLGDNSIQR